MYRHKTRDATVAGNQKRAPIPLEDSEAALSSGAPASVVKQPTAAEKFEVSGKYGAHSTGEIISHEHHHKAQNHEDDQHGVCDMLPGICDICNPCCNSLIPTSHLLGWLACCLPQFRFRPQTCSQAHLYRHGLRSGISELQAMDPVNYEALVHHIHNDPKFNKVNLLNILFGLSCSVLRPLVGRGSVFAPVVEYSWSKCKTPSSLRTTGPGKDRSTFHSQAEVAETLRTRLEDCSRASGSAVHIRR